MRHLEIERKYLVDPGLWERVDKPEARKLIQGYLCQDDLKIIRVRIVRIGSGEKGFLTIKGKMENLGRPEFEYDIPVAEARELIALSIYPPIEKTRYKYRHLDKVWDVDIFHGANVGLFLAEVELDEPGEEIRFPEWVGEEVSHDFRYYNAYLAQHPFTTWK